jgi:hypothetical protein
MLDLETFKIEMSSNKNGGLIIKINKDKIAYDHSADMDYFKQAKKYIESKGYNVIGYNHLSKIMVASLEKYDLKRVYKFCELSDKVKLKVIEKFQNDDYDYLDSTNDYLVELLNNLGFTDVDLEYSASYSQSDYFRFTGTFEQIDMLELQKDYAKVDDVLEIIALIENLDIPTFKRTGNGFEILDDYMMDTYENQNNIQKVLTAIDRMIKIVIYNEIDYQSQDSTIIVNIEANEYEFYENGEIV